MRVLVVDDETVLLDMFAALVEELGHTCLVAANGNEALALLNAQPEPPALIISDIMMPHMSGTELLQAIRAEPRFANVPVVLMSAASTPPIVPEANAFLHKPFTLDQIIDLLADFSLRAEKGSDAQP